MLNSSTLSTLSTVEYTKTPDTAEIINPNSIPTVPPNIYKK